MNPAHKTKSHNKQINKSKEKGKTFKSGGYILSSGSVKHTKKQNA